MNVADVKKKLEELGVNAKKSLGQNFLVSPVVIERILQEAKSVETKDVLEIGPGLGALTEPLRRYTQETDKTFQVIELDRMFSEVWRQEGLKVWEIDALKLDWKTLELGASSLLVSNLPYQISSSLVIERSIEPFGITNMILMFQKEVAQRIQSEKASKSYGLLSVVAQTFWHTRRVIEAGPREFWPPPQIASQVLRFEEKETDLPRREFVSFVKQAFQQRRKFLRKNLSGYKGLSSAELTTVLESLEYPETVRAEELSPEEFKLLYKKLNQ